MTIPILCIISGAVLLSVFCIKRVHGSSPTVAMIKALVSFLFIATAMSSVAFTDFDFTHIRFVFFIILGLICGMLGDIALDLKYAHRKSSDQYSYAGFIAFFAGHIFYDIGLISEFYIKGNADKLIVPLIICVLTFIFIRFSEKLLKVNYGKFRSMIMLYSAALISLSAFSFSLALLHGFKNIGLDIIFGGSIFFMISDFILSGTYFGVGKDRPVDIVVNHVTYYIAQFAIAISLRFISK